MRSPQRKALDERIAAEPPPPMPDIPPGTPRHTFEELFPRRHRRPIAILGVVENGLVRPVDTGVNLPEKSQVIIVATTAT